MPRSPRCANDGLLVYLLVFLLVLTSPSWISYVMALVAIVLAIGLFKMFIGVVVLLVLINVCIVFCG